MELTNCLVLGKIMRIRVCKENVHVQLKSAIRDTCLQWGREGAGVEGYQHFGAPVKCERRMRLKSNVIKYRNIQLIF